MVILSYVFPGCEFKSEDATEAIACTLLQSHTLIHARASTIHLAYGMSVSFNEICLVAIRQEHFLDFKSVFKPPKQHIRNGFSVNCPIVGFSKPFSDILSLTSHLSRCHKHALHGGAYTAHGLVQACQF